LGVNEGALWFGGILCAHGYEKDEVIDRIAINDKTWMILGVTFI
jgi:hypothetical protein